MRNRTSKALFVALVGLALTGAVSAFVLLDPPRTWDNAPTYIVDQGGASSITDNDGGVSATISAITSNQAWNGSGNGNLISAQSGNTNNVTLGDGTPMLVFSDPFHVCNGNCLAATFTGFFEDRSDGSVRIFDADIVTSTRFDFTTESEPDGCSGEFFMEGIQVHEIGHGLGLGHSNVSGATMFPSVSSCDNGPASISSDDDAGMDALYGGGGPGGGDPPCELLAKGEVCTDDAECCSGKCKGGGTKTCK